MHFIQISNMNNDIIEGLHDFYLLRLGTIVMFREQPVKLTCINRIHDRKRLEYEFTNIFTNQKFTETAPDLQNHRFYWLHWAHGIKKFNLFLDAPKLQKNMYIIIDVNLPNKIICLDQEAFNEKTFEISELTAVRIQLLLRSNPDMDIKVSEICWRGQSKLEFDQTIQ